MSSRTNIATGSKWEPIIGYSRAVRVGDMVFVAGTTAAGADAATQTTEIWKIIDGALQKAGASLKDVVRTRIYCTDISQWEAIGAAHGAVFGEIRPVTAMVQVAKLISDDNLVEIEADAVISN